MKQKFKKFTLLILFTIGITPINAQILYRISGNEMTKPSYIFGSHHLSPINVVEESGVMEYFNQTDKVVGEIDLTLDPMTIAMAVQPHMMAPADSTLTVLLAGEDIETLDKQFSQWAPMPGMSLKQLDMLKPLAVSTMIAAKLSSEAMPGYNPEEQLDTYFFKEGLASGKNLVALETPEYQGEILFDTTPLSVQAESLIDMLKNPEESVEMARKLSSAYKSRNMEEMLALSEENDQHPEFMKRILFDRNKNWLEKLPGIIKDSPSFIVVGALHLPGEEGVLEGLKKDGFEITPIY